MPFHELKGFSGAPHPVSLFLAHSHPFEPRCLFFRASVKLVSSAMYFMKRKRGEKTEGSAFIGE